MIVATFHNNSNLSELSLSSVERSEE